MKGSLLFLAALLFAASAPLAATYSAEPVKPAGVTVPAPPVGNILLVPLAAIDGKTLPDTGEFDEKKSGDHTVACQKANPDQSKPATSGWCPPLTLRALAVNVLTATFCADPRTPCPAALTSERDVGAGQKIARADLARRIYMRPKEVQLTTDEKSLLKRLISAIYPGTIAADVVPLLDPAEKPEAIKP